MRPHEQSSTKPGLPCSLLRMHNSMRQSCPLDLQSLNAIMCVLPYVHRCAWPLPYTSCLRSGPHAPCAATSRLHVLQTAPCTHFPNKSNGCGNNNGSIANVRQSRCLRIQSYQKTNRIACIATGSHHTSCLLKVCRYIRSRTCSASAKARIA